MNVEHRTSNIEFRIENMLDLNESLIEHCMRPINLVERMQRQERVVLNVCFSFNIERSMFIHE